MRRREFIATIGATLGTWPLAVRASGDERIRRIGVLAAPAENDPEQRKRMSALLEALQQLGWRRR